MTPPAPRSPRALLEESAWVQRLARRLVHESAAAEDVAQDALLVALTRPPAPTVPLRRWLAGVVRNLARARRRGDAQRSSREAAQGAERAAAGRGDGGAFAGGAELAERLEVQERLVAAVRALDEPYRSTVALRYLEDLGAVEVAARLGVPVKTVHTRLERALAKLRERLDHEHGSRDAWAGLLLPLAGPPGVPPQLSPHVPPYGAAALAPLTPLVAMGTTLKLSAAALAVTAVGLFVLQRDGAGRTRTAALEREAREASGAGLELAQAPAEAVRATAELDAPADGAAPAPVEAVPTPGAAAPAQVVGFVLDLARRPVAGLEVRYASVDHGGGVARSSVPEDVAESAADGGFVLPERPGHLRIVAKGEGLATVRGPVLAGPLPPEPVVVFVGPERHYGGVVRGEDGAPIAGADVAVHLPRELAEELTPDSINATLAIARVASGADGRFVLPDLGFAAGSRLTAEAEGHMNVTVPLPEDSCDTLELTLGRRALALGSLAGRVLLADGGPAAGAYVAAGGASVRADADGRFGLTPGADERPTRLRAALPGVLPAELDLARIPEDRHGALELVLGGPGLTIQGRVRDAAGAPLAGVRVWTTDGERFGDVLTRLGDVHFQMAFDVEDVIDGTDDGLGDGRDRRSGADGAFTLTGLTERSYRLWAMHPDTFERVGPLEVAAGTTGLDVVLDGLERRARVAGQVLSLAGVPLAGVSVRVARDVTMPDGHTVRHQDDASDGLVTDVEGRFEFPALCVAGTSLHFAVARGTSSVPLELAQTRDLERLEVSLPAICHFQLRLLDPARASSVQLHDASGRALDLTFAIGGVLCMANAVQILDGRTEPITADERGVMLVLTRAGVEVERVPVRLVPGRLNELEL